MADEQDHDDELLAPPLALPYVPFWADEKQVLSNHTGYGHVGSENFEHDDTGSLMNYSGCADDILTATAEHEDWQEGYDY